MVIIYLSGIDGCGKTTQAKLLKDRLAMHGFSAEYTWFRWQPSLRRLIDGIKRFNDHKLSMQNTDICDIENIGQHKWLMFKRKALSISILRKIWIFYACFDYYKAYKKRFQKPRCDKLFVIDRYVDDFIIDQSINFDIPPEKSNHIKTNSFIKKIPYPDYRIIIDLPAQKGYLRKKDGTSQFYLMQRESYYSSICGPNTLHVDGTKDINTIHEIIFSWVLKRIGIQS